MEHMRQQMEALRRLIQDYNDQLAPSDSGTPCYSDCLTGNYTPYREMTDAEMQQLSEWVDEACGLVDDTAVPQNSGQSEL